MSIKKILLLILLLCPVFVNAKTCDTGKISISSIKFVEKNGFVSGEDKAYATDKNINLDLSMAEKGDNVTYRVTIKNDSSDDFEFDKSKININSPYITYSFESDGNIIKANSTKDVLLRIEYTNLVPSDKFNGNVYNDTNNMKVNLSSDNNVVTIIKNPKTSLNLIVVIFIISIVLLTFVFIWNNKIAKTMLLIIGILFIPFSVYALCKCEITIDSKVEIQRSDQFCIKWILSQKPTLYFTFTDEDSLKSYFSNIIYNLDDYDDFSIKNKPGYQTVFNLYYNDVELFEYCLEDDNETIRSFSLYPNTFNGQGDVMNNYFYKPIINSLHGCYSPIWTA